MCQEKGELIPLNWSSFFQIFFLKHYSIAIKWFASTRRNIHRPQCCGKQPYTLVVDQWSTSSLSSSSSASSSSWTCRLWEAATDLVNLNTWFSWQSSITPLDSLPLAVGKVFLHISLSLSTVFIIWTGVQSRLQLARTIGSIFTAGEGHRDGGNKVRFKKTTWTKQTSEFLSAKENCTWSRKLPLSQNHSSVFTGLPSQTCFLQLKSKLSLAFYIGLIIIISMLFSEERKVRALNWNCLSQKVLIFLFVQNDITLDTGSPFTKNDFYSSFLPVKAHSYFNLVFKH